MTVNTLKKTPLNSPITRKGGEQIETVGLRKPSVGDLRGMKLSMLLQMDVNAMATLLPRITEPALLPDEVAALDPADFFALSLEALGFFMTADQVAAAQDAAGTI